MFPKAELRGRLKLGNHHGLILFFLTRLKDSPKGRKENKQLITKPQYYWLFTLKQFVVSLYDLFIIIVNGLNPGVMS